MKYLIAGLGNPGSEYANTRHNVGFLVVDALAQTSGVNFQSNRYADTATFRHRGRTLLLIKPTTYMNLSGKAVRYWLDKENIPRENLLVVADDLDLTPGSLRLRSKGSGGSHNGLNHIIEILGTPDFARLRIGIGSEFARGKQVDYVLGTWTPEEEKTMIPVIRDAAEAILMFVSQGVEKTMNHVNRKGPSASSGNEQGIRS